MSVTGLPNLEHVYAKWEKRGPPTEFAKGHRHGDGVDTTKATAAGKQKWRDKFGQNVQSLRYRKSGVRERNKVSVLSSEVVKSNSICQFKVTPSVLPEQFIVSRPFMGSCCTCMPNSQKDLMMFNTQTSGIRNMLDVAHEMRRGGWLSRRYSIAAYVWQTRTQHVYHDVSEVVLNSQRVVDAVQQERLTGTATSSEKALEKRAKQIIKVMKANISNMLTKLTSWFLHHLLGRLLNGIHVHKGQIQMVKAASERGLPVLYLPLHKSHLDYILITWILTNYEVKSPFIAAGDNLNIPVFNWLMKGLGGFYIRRKLDNSKKKDTLYRAILQSYMEELLRNGEGMEFFVEGGRSRTGKAYLPKGGLMAVVVDTLSRGVIEDVYIAPISISYEKLLDGNFNSEQMGIPKRGESFFGAIRAIWRVVNGHYGSVRVDFAQPFSLKEYIQSNQTTSPAGLTSPDTCSPPLSPGLLYPTHSPFLRSCSSSSTLLGSEVIAEEQRRVIKRLGEHVVYNCVQSSALMCTNILAFLLLNKHRQGATVTQIVKDYAWLQGEIMFRKRDVGFSPSSVTEEVVHYAAALLSSELVQKRASDTETETVMVPSTDIPPVFELSYYSNQVVSVFLLESVVVNSVIYLSDTSLSNPDCSSQREVILISRDEVLEVAEQLCTLLKHEFLFVPSCSRLDEVLADTLDRLVTSEILKVQDGDQFDAYHNTYDKQWATRLSHSLSWAEEDEEGEEYYNSEQLLKVNLDQTDIREKMRFLHAVLAPFFEAYLVTAFHISQINEREMPEDEFLKKLHSHAKNRVSTGVASYGESAAFETLKNAIKAFQDMKIIDIYTAGNLPVITLHDHFEVKEKLNQYIHLLESLRD